MQRQTIGRESISAVLAKRIPLPSNAFRLVYTRGNGLAFLKFDQWQRPCSCSIARCTSPLFAVAAKKCEMRDIAPRPPPTGRTWDRPLAYGVVFLRLGGGLGCFSPAIDNYID